MPDAPVPAPPLPWWQRWRRAPVPSPAPPVPPAALDSLPPLGGFRAERLIGRGASGPVYLARGATQVAALKLFQPDPAWSSSERAEQRERFVRQAEVLSALTHPDIIAVLASGEHDGLPWLAMELAPGSDLSRYTVRQRLLPEPLVLRIGARVARALAHAHRHGVVHRDLKPANVRVDLGHDRVKLVDFGVARREDQQVTRTGVTLGTPAYMAPEQLAGAAADASTDTYALGVMLYELLTGRLPFPASTLGELLRAVAAGEPTSMRHWRADLPEAVEQLVSQLLQREPAARPADLVALADDLARCADTLPRPGGA